VDWSEIGKGGAACQNPPWQSEHDNFAWEFYFDNSSAFSREYGVFPVLITDLGLSYYEKSLFVRKLSMIYDSMLSIAEREREKNAESSD